MKESLGQSNFSLARISYVPEFLPDELIYSWIGRLIHVNALGYPKDCLMQLFGNRNVIPSIDIPTLLTPLYQRLGENSPFDSVTKLLEFGTLYPYHRPFLNIEREQAVQNIMFHHHGKGLKVLMGRVANRFGANPAMRFCNICNKEDTEIFGSPYWKRSHQLPGINCCLKHQIHLETYVPTNLIFNRHRYILPPYIQNLTEREYVSATELSFAEISNNLLHAGLPSIAPSIRKHVYKEAAIAAGCGSRLGHIDYGTLALNVREHYNDFSGFIHQQRLLSSPKQPLCWLNTLIDRPERSCHPICHLLLIGFLFHNIDTFIEYLKSYCSIDQFSNSKPNKDNCKFANEHLLIQNISLSCRQVAKLLNLSTTTVVCKRRQLCIPINERRKTLENDLIKNINIELLSGAPLKEIALHNNVSLTTVYRLRAQSKLLINIYHDKDLKIRESRQHWLKLISDNPDTGSTILRSISPETYAWLYKHDKDWLTKTNLCIKSFKKSKQRINWEERDFNLSKQLSNYVVQIKKLHDRPRISKTLMLGVVGDAMVRNNLQRLPILEKRLYELIETKFEYQLFRIDHAIDTLIKQSKPLNQSNIQRTANIKDWTPNLNNYANNQLQIFSNHLKYQ